MKISAPLRLSWPRKIRFSSDRATLRDRMLSVIAASLSMGAGLHAASISYDGGPGGSGTEWGDAVNWAGDVIPGATDTALFSVFSTTLTINLGTSREVAAIGFNSANTTYTIGSASDVALGNSLTVGHVKRDTTAGGLQTIVANVGLSASSSIWEINSGYNNGLLVTGIISGAGKSLNKWGGGNLMLGAANTFDGGVFVNFGTLTLDFAQATAPTGNIIAPSNALTIGPATLAAAGKAGSAVSQTFASTKLDAGASSFTIANGNTANTRTSVNLGAISRDLGTTVNFVQPTGTSSNTVIAANNGYSTSTANDGSGILGGWATVGGTEWAANDGTNIVAFTGYTDLTGVGPTIADSPASNIRITGSSTGDIGQGSGTTTVNTIRSSDAAARTITVGTGNTLRLGSTGGLLATGGGGLTVGVSGSEGSLTAGGADNTAGELFLNNTTAVTVNSVITDNGTGKVALVKAGSGTATLNSAAAHTGGTYVNAGLLQLTAGTDRLSTTGEIAVYGGTLNLGGSTQNHSGSLIIGAGALNSSSAVVGATISSGTINKSGSSIDARGGTISAVITGTAGIAKSTAGVLALGNATANTFTGTTFITEGTVVGGAAANAVGISGDLVVGSVDGTQLASYRNAGSNVAFSSTRNLTVYANGSVNFGGGSQHIGTGATISILGGTVAGSGVYQQSTVNMTAGTWAATTYGNNNSFNINASADTAYITGSLNATASKTFTVADGGAAIDLLVSGNIAGSSSNLTKAGTGLMQIIGNKNYGGTTTVSAGILAVDSLANGGAVSSTGTSSSAASSLLLRDGSTFRYTGSATSTDRLFTVGQTGAGQSATLDASGGGAVSFTNSGSLAWGSGNQTRTLILSGTNSGDNSLAATIGNNGTGAVSLTKNGDGKWILAGVNSYTGTTAINAGTLLVNGSLGNSAVEINGGTFGGSGVVGGAVSVNSGGTLAPGASIETLDTGAVSFASNSTFALEINTNDVQIDRLNVTGNLSIAGGALLTLTELGSGAVLNTTLTIVSYTGLWNGGFFTYEGNVLGNGASFNYGANTYTINYADAGAVTLAVSAVPEPATVALLGVALGGLVLGRRRRS